MSASSLQRKVLASGALAAGTLPPMLPPSHGGRGRRAAATKDFSASSWTDYFDEKTFVHVSEGESFNVYRKGVDGPLFLLIHGAGYSGLSWACFAKELFELINCQILAPDLRGHGETSTLDDYSLSAEAQTNDIARLFRTLYPPVLNDGSDSSPPTFLIGHSMGGAIAVHVAKAGVIANLIGLTVIDVCEGSAMEALQGMLSVLRNRPERFRSVEEAVEWSVRSGQTRNLEAARISMPAQIRRADARVTSPEDVRACSAKDLASSETVIEEEDDEQGPPSAAAEATSGFRAPTASSYYVWRTDLFRTEPFWADWFRGMSSMFLNDVHVPRLLVLAGVDRLDRELTVGQMQGKFQMCVLPKVSHAVHEDAPDKVAELISAFAVRHRLCEPKQAFRPGPMPGC